MRTHECTADNPFAQISTADFAQLYACCRRSGGRFAGCELESARGKVLSLQNEADRKLLTQINYNIENMNGIVKDLAVSLYNDEELLALKSGADYKQSILKIERLNHTVAASPYLHAAVFYNGAQHRFFSSLNHEINNSLLYDSLKKYMNSRADLPKLQLIPLDLDGKDGGLMCLLHSFMTGSLLVLSMTMC